MSIRRIRINYIILIKDIIPIKIIYNGINPHDLKNIFSKLFPQRLAVNHKVGQASGSVYKEPGLKMKVPCITRILESYHFGIGSYSKDRPRLLSASNPAHGEKSELKLEVSTTI